MAFPKTPGYYWYIESATYKCYPQSWRIVQVLLTLEGVVAFFPGSTVKYKEEAFPITAVFTEIPIPSDNGVTT